MSTDLYARLAAPFDETFTRTVSGRSLTYASGEQVTSRLNQELGFDGWSFEVLNVTVTPGDVEVWATGRLTVYTEARTVVREQAGGQIVNRTRAGEVIELSNDIKGAVTDAMKKCASLIGVGLYLSERGNGASQRQQPQERPTAPPQPRNQPQATEIPLADRETLTARYGELLDHARQLGHRASWSTNDPSKMSDIQIARYSALLENYIARNQTAEGAA